MCKKSIALYCCMLPFIVSSSVLWPTFTHSNKEEDYSTVRSQLNTNTMKHYDDKENLYNLYENSTKDYSDIHYSYSNFASNNRKDSDMIQYKFRAPENDSQISVESRINSLKISSKKKFMLRRIHGLKEIKSKNNSMYDSFKNFNRDNKSDIFLYNMCDDITCIRLCCPFGNRLVNGRCTSMYGFAEQGNFIFLENMYGYINDSLQNESKRVEKSFLLIVHDPCQKTAHYLLNPSYNTFFLANGSLYLSYYNTIIESTFYCLAVVDYNIFAVNVCFDVIKKIMNKTINDENTIYPINTNKDLKNAKDKNGSASHDFFKNSNRNDNKDNIIPYKMCDNVTCIRLCCPFGNRLVNGRCIAEQGNFIFLHNMYGYINSLQNESKSVGDLFLLLVDDPCKKTGYYSVKSLNKNVFFLNGSLYLDYYNIIIESTSYCLANVAENRFTVNVCLDIMKTRTIIFICCLLGIMLFSLMMFIVYSIVPELRNIYGFILRRYSSLIFAGGILELVNILIRKEAKEDFICIVIAFVRYYITLASCFWLNVMSFDMWRTFRQLRSLQRNMKQQKRKKLIIYSVFAWGSPFMLSIICGILDFVPGIPNNFRPNFSNKCWFEGNMTYLLYFHGVVVISLIISICLSICTAQKITYYEKNISHHLKDSESRCYNNNKQWFKLHVDMTKVVFIIICIKWYIFAIQALNDESSLSVWYVICALTVIEHFCIFLIFVWKKRIRQLLLKRFGWQNCSICFQ